MMNYSFSLALQALPINSETQPHTSETRPREYPHYGF
ncbi:hypothetical protein KLQUCK414M1_06975 [Klebsiella quasipneumoniae subsp. similipneumoniae]